MQSVVDNNKDHVVIAYHGDELFSVGKFHSRQEAVEYVSNWLWEISQTQNDDNQDKANERDEISKRYKQEILQLGSAMDYDKDNGYINTTFEFTFTNKPLIVGIDEVSAEYGDNMRYTQ